MFHDIPRAISNTRTIAEKCNLRLSLGNIDFPHFNTPANESEEGYLKKLCYGKGLEWRYGSSPPSEVLSRLEKELKIIAETGFCGYFLIVADIAGYARKNNISRVCIFSTLRPRAAIREAGRIMGWSKEDIDPVIKTDHDLLSYPNRYNIDSGKINGDPWHMDTKNMQYKKITCISGKIESYPRHISMHPSAFIVSGSSLAKKIPLTLSETREIISQYDKNSIEDLGLLKIDLINSLSLSLINDTAEMLKSKRNVGLNITKIDHDDKKTFDLIKKGKTLGVFQRKSFGIRKLAKKIKPSNLNDITLLIF